MNDRETLAAIQEQLARFERADADILTAVQRRELGTVGDSFREALLAHQNLESLLVREAVVTVGPDLRERLNRFRRREFAVSAVISQALQGQFDVDLGGDAEVYPDEHIEYLRGQFIAYATHMPEGEAEPIAQRLLECRTVVSVSHMPAWAKKQLMSIRRCYALELFEPGLALCRCFLEACAHSWLQRRGVLATRRNDQALSFADRSLRATLNDVARRASIPRATMADVWALVDRCNQLLHPRRDSEVTREECLRAIGVCAQYAERLFSH
jgi:hypothetical protein